MIGANNCDIRLRRRLRVFGDRTIERAICLRRARPGVALLELANLAPKSADSLRRIVANGKQPANGNLRVRTHKMIAARSEL